MIPEEIISLAAAGNYADALALLDKQLDSGPFAPDCLEMKARMLKKMKRYPEALDVYHTLLNLLPDKADYYEGRGLVYYHLQDIQPALADLSRAIALDSRNAYRYACRAYIREATRDLAGALADYTRALELDPDDAVAANNRSLLEEKLARTQLGQEDFADGATLQQRSSGLSATASRPAGSRLTWRSYFRTLSGLLASAAERKKFWRFLFGKPPAR